MAGVASDAFVDGEKCTVSAGLVHAAEMMSSWGFCVDRPCENMGPGRYGPVTFRGRDDGAGPGKSKGEKHTKLQAMRVRYLA
jgi:hypothetical protein